jgi:hypothetical protein
MGILRGGTVLWIAFPGAAGSAVFVAARASVGTHADANTKCVAVDSPGEWSPPRPRPVEPRRTRTKQDRVVEYLAGIHAHHSLVVVPFCSHSQRCMFTSDVELPLIFPN